MDAEFDRRWRESLPPFDGATVTLTQYLPLELLQKSLISVVEQLHEYSCQVPLFCLDDWHEHDGYVTKGRLASWQQLDDLLVSPEALMATCTGDTYVRKGYFSLERDYYLRIYVPDKYDNPFHSPDDPDFVECDLFDVTCSQLLAERVAATVRATGVKDLDLIPAKRFFDRSYGG